MASLFRLVFELVGGQSNGAGLVVIILLMLVAYLIHTIDVYMCHLLASLCPFGVPVACSVEIVFDLFAVSSCTQRCNE